MLMTADTHRQGRNIKHRTRSTGAYLWIQGQCSSLGDKGIWKARAGRTAFLQQGLKPISQGLMVYAKDPCRLERGTAAQCFLNARFIKDRAAAGSRLIRMLEPMRMAVV